MKKILEYAAANPKVNVYLPEERDWVHLDRAWVCNLVYTVDNAGFQELINVAQ